VLNVSGIDRLERLKAIPIKLFTIEQFLAENPIYLDKIVFVLIGITASERGDDYLQTQRDVNVLVANINSKYPGTVYFEERKESEMKLLQRLALFYASDVLLNTAVRSAPPLSCLLFFNGSLFNSMQRWPQLPSY
jgi:trehalose 6-phosphate synthase/phosphatase